MAIFEKTEYWGLKDPLEVRVQHGTCIYMGDTFSSHFEPKKFNRVGRRGQKQPKWGYFGTSKQQIQQIYRDMKFISRGLPGRCDVRKPIKVNWSIRRTRGTGDTVLLCFSNCRHKVLTTFINFCPMLFMKLDILINMKSNKKQRHY